MVSKKDPRGDIVIIESRESTKKKIALQNYNSLMSFYAIKDKVLKIYMDDYEELIEHHGKLNKKKILSLRNKLLKTESIIILSFFWKESPFIGEDDLNHCGLKRSFKKEDLNPSNLAYEITQNSLINSLQRENLNHDILPFKITQCAKKNNSVRLDISKICEAAEHFGLIKKIKIKNKKIRIEITEELHDIMMVIYSGSGGSC